MNYNEEKKKGNVLLVIVIVLLVILIGVGGVIIYQNYQNKNDSLQDVGTADQTDDDNVGSENNNQEPNVKDLSLDSTIVRELSSIFYGKYLSASLDDYNDYFYKNNKTEISLAPVELKVWMTLKKMGLPEVITESKLKDEYFGIFGKNTTYYAIDEINYCPSYEYNSNNGFYSKLSDGCGGTGCGGSTTKLIGAKEIIEKNQKRIEITEAVAFEKCPFSDSNPSEVISEFYKDYKYSEFVEEYDNSKNPLDVHPEKYAQYKYIFVEDNSGVYVFTSVERVK